MALQSAFKERFEDMESTRKQRLSHLQAEKDLQKNKSILVSAKYSNIRSLEQRCLILDQKFASDNFKISYLKSEIDFLNRKYETCSIRLRDLKCGLEELQNLLTEREGCYTLKRSEMEHFRDETRAFSGEIRVKIEDLLCHRDELKSLWVEVQKRNKQLQILDIQAAEIRKSELLALKGKTVHLLQLNKREKSELQRQLQSLSCLLIRPSGVGYEQNPLSLYYFFDVDGSTSTLKKCIAEGTNTPWDKRVSFVFNPRSYWVTKAFSC